MQGREAAGGSGEHCYCWARMPCQRAPKVLTWHLPWAGGMQARASRVQTQTRHRPGLQQGTSPGASYSSLGGSDLWNSRRCVRHPSWTFASTPPLLLALPRPRRTFVSQGAANMVYGGEAGSSQCMACVGALPPRAARPLCALRPPLPSHTAAPAAWRRQGAARGAGRMHAPPRSGAAAAAAACSWSPAHLHALPSRTPAAVTWIFACATVVAVFVAYGAWAVGA